VSAAHQDVPIVLVPAPDAGPLAAPPAVPPTADEKNRPKTRNPKTSQPKPPVNRLTDDYLAPPPEE
jgi:hypothetical protein